MRRLSNEESIIKIQNSKQKWLYLIIASLLGAITVLGFAPFYIFPIPIITVACLLYFWRKRLQSKSSPPSFQGSRGCPAGGRRPVARQHAGSATPTGCWKSAAGCSELLPGRLPVISGACCEQYVPVSSR